MQPLDQVQQHALMAGRVQFSVKLPVAIGPAARISLTNDVKRALYRGEILGSHTRDRATQSLDLQENAHLQKVLNVAVAECGDACPSARKQVDKTARGEFPKRQIGRASCRERV